MGCIASSRAEFFPLRLPRSPARRQQLSGRHRSPLILFSYSGWQKLPRHGSGRPITTTRRVAIIPGRPGVGSAAACVRNGGPVGAPGCASKRVERRPLYVRTAREAGTQTAGGNAPAHPRTGCAWRQAARYQGDGRYRRANPAPRPPRRRPGPRRRLSHARRRDGVGRHRRQSARPAPPRRRGQPAAVAPGEDGRQNAPADERADQPARRRHGPRRAPGADRAPGGWWRDAQSDRQSR